MYRKYAINDKIYKCEKRYDIHRVKQSSCSIVFVKMSAYINIDH